MAIVEILQEYIFVFKEREFFKKKKDFGKLSTISEVFQKCFLNDPSTDKYFLNLINDVEGDYSRYYFFYINYLVENQRLIEAQKLVENIDYINSTLLLSQGKSWIENGNEKILVNSFHARVTKMLLESFSF